MLSNRCLLQVHEISRFLPRTGSFRAETGNWRDGEVVVGFDCPLDPTTSNRPAPLVRLELAGYIPARTADPKASNNRAELAGVLAALLALLHIGQAHDEAPVMTIWSDSDLTVKCGNGTWARKKNTDLWQVFDDLSRTVTSQLGRPVPLMWLKGHAGNPFNEAADNLATLAACNFDRVSYEQLRASQTTSGREMPGNAPRINPVAGAADGGSTDYSIVLSTHLDGQGQPNVGRGQARGDYLLQTRTGHSHRGRVVHPGFHGADEGEYMTLIAALGDLLSRIEGQRRDPGAFTVTVTSLREVVIKQLGGIRQSPRWPSRKAISTPQARPRQPPSIL